MHLEINGERMISEIQDDFCKVFPYLKIEFYRNGIKRQEHYPASKLIAPSMTLRDAWVFKKEDGKLRISGDMSVNDLENAFMDEFGLSTQVFRRAGKIWLETTMTDNWSLNQQNDHGREITNTTDDSIFPGSGS